MMDSLQLTHGTRVCSSWNAHCTLVCRFKTAASLYHLRTRTKSVFLVPDETFKVRKNRCFLLLWEYTSINISIEYRIWLVIRVPCVLPTQWVSSSSIHVNWLVSVSSWYSTTGPSEIPREDVRCSNTLKGNNAWMLCVFLNVLCGTMECFWEFPVAEWIANKFPWYYGMLVNVMPPARKDRHMFLIHRWFIVGCPLFPCLSSNLYNLYWNQLHFQKGTICQ